MFQSRLTALAFHISPWPVCLSSSPFRLSYSCLFSISIHRRRRNKVVVSVNLLSTEDASSTDYRYCILLDVTVSLLLLQCPILFFHFLAHWPLFASTCMLWFMTMLLPNAARCIALAFHFPPQNFVFQFLIFQLLRLTTRAAWSLKQCMLSSVSFPEVPFHWSENRFFSGVYIFLYVSFQPLFCYSIQLSHIFLLRVALNLLVCFAFCSLITSVLLVLLIAFSSFHVFILHLFAFCYSLDLGYNSVRFF